MKEEWSYQCVTAGEAKRLSTGTEKNPWIWPAWRSMVTTWSAPAQESSSATSLAWAHGLLESHTRMLVMNMEPYLAMMGVLGLSTLSALAKG